jgi:ketosteroid isomerase-like protein
VSASSSLDLVRSIYADWERGDWRSVEWAHPEIEFVIADGPDPGSWTGIAAMGEAWRDRLSAWEDPRFEVDAYRDLDDERVLVLGVFHGRFKITGLETGEIPAKAANLLHVRGRKVTRIVIYNDRDRAFADVRLAPEDG